MPKKKSVITKYTKNCIICGRPTNQMHHCLSGSPGRELADEDGLIVPLCPYHHNESANFSVHLNPAIATWSKIVGQLAFEEEMLSTGKATTKEEARELFRKRYDKSFL